MKFILWIQREKGNFSGTEENNAYKEVNMPIDPFIGLEIKVSDCDFKVTDIQVNIDDNYVLVSIDPSDFVHNPDGTLDEIVSEGGWDIGGEIVLFNH